MSHKEFRINKFLTLKLENNRTNIYVNNKLFTHCKYLLIDIPADEFKKFDDVESINEAVDVADDNALSQYEYEILPEIEFFGHCSNLEAWAENNYDTTILDYRLSFPLLRELVDAGDPVAKEVLSNEVEKRLKSDYPNVINYLIKEGYLKYSKGYMKKINNYLSLKFEDVGIDRYIDIYINGEVVIGGIGGRFEHPRYFELKNLKIKHHPTLYMNWYESLKLWADNDYDAQLLDIRISLPILEDLRKAGDPIASKKFKEELLKYLQDAELLKSYNIFVIPDLTEDEINFLLENLFSKKGFFNIIKNFHDDDIRSYFYSLQIEKYFQKYAPTCPSEILVDIMYCLTRIYVTGSYSNIDWMATHRNYNGYKVLTSLFTDILSNQQFFEKLVGIYKILIDKEDWKFFYNIGYLLFESSKNMSPELKDNIKEYLLHGNEKDIEAIVKSRWLEQFEPDELEDLFFNIESGMLEKLSMCKYWVSNQKTRVWHFFDETYPDNYVLHSNLAFPVFKKLFHSGNDSVHDVIAKEIQNLFKSEDISGILYLIQEDFMQFAEKQMKRLISNLSIDTCKKLLNELLYNRAYDDQGFEISSNLFSVEKFKKKIKKLYEEGSNFLSDEEWEFYLDDFN